MEKEAFIGTIKKYAVRLFAAIGVLMTTSMLLGALTAWHWVSHPAPPIPAPKNMILELDLSRNIVEQSGDLRSSVFSLLGENENIDLIDVVRAIDRAKDDPRVKGIVARLGSTPPSLVHAQEIRAALLRFRQSGKFTYIHAASYGEFGRGNRAYYLASVFENIWLQPVGSVGLTGLGIETPFGKSALGKIGVSADFLRREEYKSVMENVTRDEFSGPVRANMEGMLKSLSEQQTDGIAEGRKMDVKKVRDLVASGPFTASEALRADLITHIGYEDDMLYEARLLAAEPQVKPNKSLLPVRVGVMTYLVFSTPKKETKATVALINGLGMITDAAPSGPSHLSDSHFIDTKEIVEAFDDAANDKEVKAILFRIDSPGGSPSASETIRHALVKAKKSHKPVFVSMGEVAASGGYWIAMNADRIIAEPGTLTGSIGVVAGKFVLGELFQKLGIKWDNITLSDNARMGSMLAPYSPAGRERVNALLDDTYIAFTTNVAAARKIPVEKMPDLAKGRIWTGDQAVKVGLVDELGGLQTTVAALKKELKLADTDSIALKLFPPPETTTSLVLKVLKNFGIEGVMVHSFLGSWLRVQGALGPTWDELLDTSAVNARVPADVLRVVQ